MTEDERAPARVARATHGGVIVAYLGLTVLVTWPLALNMATAIPGGGDSWQFYWNLWWTERALVDLQTSPFFTPDLYYPHGADLHFHTLNLLPNVLALPVVALFGLTVGYNVIAFAGFALGGYGAYRLAYYLLPDGRATERRQAAFVAGAAFTFTSYHVVHLMGHLDMVSVQWLPLYALFLFKTWREPGRWNPVLAALFLTATALTSWYYALYMLCFTLLFLGWSAAVTGGGRRLLAPSGRVASVLAMWLVTVSPVLVPMLVLGSDAGAVPDPQYDTRRFSADLLAWFVPPFLHPLGRQRIFPVYETLARNGNPIEAAVFLGYVPMALAVVALRSHTRWSYRQFWGLGLAAFTLLALGPRLHVGGHTVTLFGWPLPLPYELFARLPFADIPRNPSRFAVMSALCLAMLSGYGAFRLLTRVSTARAGLVTVALAGAVVFEQTGAPFPQSPVEMPPFYTGLTAVDRGGALLEVPIPDDPTIYPRRMLYQTGHRTPTYGGYLSRGLPPLAFSGLPGFGQFKHLRTGLDDVVRYDAGRLGQISRFVLNRHDARVVVIDKTLLTPAELARARRVAMTVLGAMPPFFEDAMTLAYRVPIATSPVAPVVWLDRGWHVLEKSQSGPRPADQARWRWLGEEAGLRLYAPSDGTIRLGLRARAFAQPRRLTILVDGVVAGTLHVREQPEDFEVQLHVTAGEHEVTLRSLDGTAVPGGGDGRDLSIACFRIEVIRDARASTADLGAVAKRP
jgi:hypothetical protein